MFLNINNQDILAVYDFTDCKENIELWENEIRELSVNPQTWAEITNWNYTEKFQYMQDFVKDEVDGKKLKEELTLQNSKPFRSFKYLIGNDGIYRQKRSDFIKEKGEQYSEKVIEINI